MFMQACFLQKQMLTLLLAHYSLSRKAQFFNGECQTAKEVFTPGEKSRAYFVNADVPLCMSGCILVSCPAPSQSQIQHLTRSRIVLQLSPSPFPVISDQYDGANVMFQCGDGVFRVICPSISLYASQKLTGCWYILWYFDDLSLVTRFKCFEGGSSLQSP